MGGLNFEHEMLVDLDVIGEACSVVVFENGMGRDECLDNDVIDVSLHLVHIHSLLSHLSVQSGQSPLTAVLLVSDELFARLVDGIVRQMHVHLVLNNHSRN